MALSWNEVRQGIREAEVTIRNAEQNVCFMVSIIIGKLKSSKIPHNYLCKLKRELKDFNMHTGKWK